jgi:glutamyl/glutaminyl-tRNA synthetase
MKITHILRAVEWISSTPKHILLYRAFGWKQPIYGHVTAILSPSGKGKMSKREGEVSAQSFLDKGYLPEAVLNYLMLLGWSPKNDREFFTLEEFVQAFDLKDLNSSNPKFDQQKLLHFNTHYIKSLSDRELAKRLKNFVPESFVGTLHATFLPLLAPLVKDRIKTLTEFQDLTSFVFTNQIKVPSSGWKSPAPEHLQSALQIIKETSDNNWNTHYLTEQFTKLIQINQWKTGHFFMNLRLAVSGQPITPPSTECLVILGKNKTLQRLDSSLSTLLP